MRSYGSNASAAASVQVRTGEADVVNADGRFVWYELMTTDLEAAKAFYKALKSVSNFEHRPLTEAVQKVQVSAFPYAYAKWEKMASNLVLAAYGTGPYAAH